MVMLESSIVNLPLPDALRVGGRGHANAFVMIEPLIAGSAEEK